MSEESTENNLGLPPADELFAEASAETDWVELVKSVAEAREANRRQSAAIGDAVTGLSRDLESEATRTKKPWPEF
jgi:hypothetical protein